MQWNPDKNPLIKAVLYVIGVGGLIHLVSLLTIAIVRQDAAYFHPLYAVDVDQLWPGVHGNWLIYVAGWLIFAAVIALVYRSLRRRT